MTLTVKHVKTVTLPDPTQADLNAQIAQGNYPPGTLLNNISLSSDWNANHSLVGVADISQGGTNANNENDAVFNLGSALPDGVGNGEDPVDSRIRYITFNDSSSQSFTFTGADIQSAISTSLSGVYQPLDSDLTALANNTTNGFWARTGAGAGAARTITGTANEITVTNGAGTAGNPTLSIPTAVTFTGKTITGGAYENASIGNTTPATIANVDNLRLDANTLSSTNTNGAINVQPNGTGAVNFGNIAGGNFWSNDSTGYLFGNGTAALGVNIDKYAFLVPGSFAGLFFRFLLGVPGQVALDLFGQEIASIDYSGTDSVVNAVYGYAGGEITTAAVTTNQNNWAGGAGAWTAYIPINAAVDFTGEVAPTNGRSQHKRRFNTGTSTVTIKHQNAGSAAANRYDTTTGADLSIPPGAGWEEIYSQSLQRWKVWKI